MDSTRSNTSARQVTPQSSPYALRSITKNNPDVELNAMYEDPETLLRQSPQQSMKSLPVRSSLRVHKGGKVMANAKQPPHGTRNTGTSSFSHVPLNLHPNLPSRPRQRSKNLSSLRTALNHPRRVPAESNQASNDYAIDASTSTSATSELASSVDSSGPEWAHSCYNPSVRASASDAHRSDLDSSSSAFPIRSVSQRKNRSAGLSSQDRAYMTRTLSVAFLNAEYGPNLRIASMRPPPPAQYGNPWAWTKWHVWHVLNVARWPFYYRFIFLSSFLVALLIHMNMICSEHSICEVYNPAYLVVKYVATAPLEFCMSSTIFMFLILNVCNALMGFIDVLERFGRRMALFNAMSQGSLNTRRQIPTLFYRCSALQGDIVEKIFLPFVSIEMALTLKPLSSGSNGRGQVLAVMACLQILKLCCQVLDDTIADDIDVEEDVQNFHNVNMTQAERQIQRVHHSVRRTQGRRIGPVLHTAILLCVLNIVLSQRFRSMPAEQYASAQTYLDSLYIRPDGNSTALAWLAHNTGPIQTQMTLNEAWK